MIDLHPYAPADAQALTPFVQSFWRTHHAEVSAQEAQAELAAWSAGRHRLFVIREDGQAVGFLHLNRRGPIACWIEDVFVREASRGRGVASEAIRQAEALVRAEGVSALCMDVVPDNLPALRLYHRLGFDRLSLVTVRKDFDPGETVRTEEIAGLTFRVRKL